MLLRSPVWDEGFTPPATESVAGRWTSADSPLWKWPWLERISEPMAVFISQGSPHPGALMVHHHLPS